MRPTVLVLLLLVSSVIADAAKEPEFILTPTAQLAPDVFKGRKIGVFGLPFTAAPTIAFFPMPAIPRAVLKAEKPAWLRAALRVGSDGKVKDLRVLEAEPKGIVEEAGSAFFRRVVFKPQKSKKTEEFETDMTLGFKFVEKKG